MVDGSRRVTVNVGPRPSNLSKNVLYEDDVVLLKFNGLIGDDDVAADDDDAAAWVTGVWKLMAVLEATKIIGVNDSDTIAAIAFYHTPML